MDDLALLIVALILITGFLTAVVLPIAALAISITSRKRLNEQLSRLEATQTLGPGRPPLTASELSLAQVVQQLTARVQRIEATLASHPRFPETVDERRRPEDLDKEPSEVVTEPVEAPPTAIPQPPEPVPPEVSPSISASVPEPAQPVTMPGVGSARPIQTRGADQIESMIGRRVAGWAAVSLILFATAFFLKYAFDNRWIGEVGRVAIGIAFGIGMCVLGFKYHLRRWRIFSQILTAGGIVLLYLSTFAAFGYYHLVTQKVAFVFLVVLIAEAAGLALLFAAPAIAIMALVGGFLTPILLHSDRDQYRSLFTYIVALDVGALALLKHWPGLSSVAYFGTQLLFWLWYNERYHPQKRLAVLIFQAAVFLIFLLAHLARQLIRREPATLEDLTLLLINPFVFFATSYHLLNSTHHDWMGVFAIGMALLYAGGAKVLLQRTSRSGPAAWLGISPAKHRDELLAMIGIALTFVTIAIPVQLRSNWITIAWSIEALTILWAGLEIRSVRLRVFGSLLFGLALGKLYLWDTPWVLSYRFRPVFTPVFNRYFLSSLAVIACLFGASILYQRVGERRQIQAATTRLVLFLTAIVTLWFVMSVETQTFFAARAQAQRMAEDAAHQRWLGQMALSVLWAAYAATLAAAGFVRRSASVRWASLVLFALTIIKAMMVDIAYLQQLYRIIVFFVLGVLLLLVAWAYHKAFHSWESAK